MDVPAWMVEQAEVPLRYFEKNSSTDIVLVGSSLLLAPVYKLLPEGVNGFDLLKNGELDFLSSPYEKAVNNCSSSRLSLANICVPGTCAQDQEALIQMLLNAKRPPKLIVYATSIRDFIDNSNKKRFEDTLMYRALHFTEQFRFDKYKDLQTLFKGELTFYRCFFKLMRSHIVTYTCDVLHRSASLWEAQQKLSTSNLGATHRLAPNLSVDKKNKDLEDYKNRYLPFDEVAYETQVESLKRMIGICAKKRQKLLVILMPVSQANYGILPSGVLKNVESDLEIVCRNHSGISFINLLNNSKVTFRNDDFYDTCHMNLEGFKKFLPVFADDIYKSQSGSK